MLYSNFSLKNKKKKNIIYLNTFIKNHRVHTTRQDLWGTKLCLPFLWKFSTPLHFDFDQAWHKKCTLAKKKKISRHVGVCYKTYLRGLSRGKIECVFGHFTKFNIRKTDFSQNSIWEKWTFHKIQCEENGLFTKFNMRKMNTSQNLIAFMFVFFIGCCTYPPYFRSQKCALPFFRSQK